jgi:DNA-binding beta-propeller fold protein YncE
MTSALVCTAQTAPLKIEKTITLDGVKGKFDHFAMDEAGNRLFAAATGNQSVEVIDLAAGKSVQSISGLGKAHGLAWIAETHRLFVADGSKGELAIYEGSPLKLAKNIKLSEDADDMAYDSVSGLLYVGHGGTDAANPAAVAVVDAKALTLVTELPVAAHPEGLEFDAASQRIFVNISDTGEVVVIDGKTHAQAAKWAIGNAKGNTPLAYDAADNLLLIGCRTPAKMIALNGKTGEQAGAAVSSTGADDLFYEPASHRAYLITGSGSVDSYSVSADGKLQTLPATKTVSGAKTGLLVPSRSELFVGVPGTSGPAEIRIYKTRD